MLIASFQKEWLVFRRDGRLTWLLLTLLIMMILGIVSSAHQYQQQQSLKLNAQVIERDRWINQGEKNPHSAAHYGIYLFKPESPLSVIDPGVSDYLGDVLFLEAHKRNTPVYTSSQDSVELQRLGTLNPAIILQLLLPLFVILSGFGFFSAEREQGTLPMLLLSGQTPRQLFFQKATALFTFSLIFLSLLAVYACLIFFAKGNLDLQRLISIFLLYFGYLIFWILLTLAVSIVTHTARKSLTILLLFWVATSLIIPKLAMDVAVHAYPDIPTQEFYSRMESDLYTAERLQAIEQYKQHTLKQYQVSHASELPFNWAGAELLFGEAYSDKVFDKLFSQQINQLEHQDKVYQKLALLSPFIGVQIISSALATTDRHHHQLFSDAAENYRRGVMHKLNASVRDHQEENYSGNEQLWSDIPPFSYEFPRLLGLGSYYDNVVFAICGWCLFIVALGGFSLRHLSRESGL